MKARTCIYTVVAKSDVLWCYLFLMTLKVWIF